MENAGPAPAVVPVESGCETAPAAAGPVPAYCALCGRAGRGWASIPGSTVAGYRCEACYRRLPDGALFCVHCGRTARHADAATWLVRHAGAGRFCTAAGPQGVPRPADGDLPGFNNIRDVGKLYGTLLGVILLWTAASHFPGGDSIRSDFLFSAVLYGAILIFAWRWRALLAPLCRWPQGDRRVWLIIPLTPFLTLAAVQGQQALVLWLGLPLHSYLDEFTRGGFGFGTALLSVAVGPAIFEEIAFRGLLLAKLSLVMSRPQALLVTSLLFSILHFNVIGMLAFLVPLAYMAGWLTLQTRSLLPAVIVHFMHNAGILYLEYLHYG
jgi:membrane protease YdiL (CAAX protease family)